MRVWSLHPKYLDTKGLVALWREALLARKVLEGKTKGYRNHPQLNRFKESGDSLSYINRYLVYVYEEAVSRAYKFDRQKINWNFTQKEVIPVGMGQMIYERKHLLNKLKIRDFERFNALKKVNDIAPNPIFYITDGGIASWEVLI